MLMIFASDALFLFSVAGRFQVFGGLCLGDLWEDSGSDLGAF